MAEADALLLGDGFLGDVDLPALELPGLPKVGGVAVELGGQAVVEGVAVLP